MNDSANVSTGLEDPNPDLGSVIWDLLKLRKHEEAMKEIKQDRHRQYIVNNSLDLIPIILKVISEGIDEEGEKSVEDVLCYIASVANSKETLIVLLEELEMHRTESYFRVLLSPLRVLLLRQVAEKTRAGFFAWVFNTLYSHVAIMELPKSYNLEGEERKLLDLDPSVQTLTKTLHMLLDFYRVFYEKVMKGELEWVGGKVKNSKEFLAFFLLQFFHKPIAFLDVYCTEEEGETSLFRTCNAFSMMIAHLLGNSFKLFSHIKWSWSKRILATADDDKEANKRDSDSENGDKDKKRDALGEEEEDEMENQPETEKKETVSQLSLACYFYCLLGQNMASDYVPCVYSPSYVFISCLPLIANLLEDKEDIPIHKGLILAKTLLNKLPERSLPNDCLEAKAHSAFPQLLIKIMIYSNNRELRTTALDVFKPYLRKFESTGRRNLMKRLFISVKHSGLLGLVIHELKENVALCLNGEVMDPNFSGANLEDLVLLACSLPDGETTDLLEWSDSIMAALNLLIFLFVRDGEDRTGIRRVLPVIQKQFLECLQKGLDLSRAHYELKLKELSETQTREKKTKKAEFSVNVGGMTLPNLPSDQEKKVVQTAICSFDMMQCVLARAMQATSSKI